MTVRRIGLLLLALLLVPGALGLTTVQQCESDPFYSRTSDKLRCYHEAAITAAYLCQNPGEPCNLAINICNSIWTRFGSSEDPQIGNDVRRKAETVRNNCFYDVAKITRNSYTCEYIGLQDNFGTQLTGDLMTKQSCINQTTRMEMILPKNYYANNPNNICAITFVLPLLVFASIIRR